MAGNSSPTWLIDGQALTETVIEFLLLLGLWMMFVSLLQWNELFAGLVAALIGGVADAVVKSTDLASFRPKPRDLLLIFRVAGEVVQNTAVVLVELFRRIGGAPSRSALQVVPFEAAGDERESSSRRALAILYSTLPPNSIVVGIDKQRGYLMMHQLVPQPESTVTRQLGGRS